MANTEGASSDIDTRSATLARTLWNMIPEDLRPTHWEFLGESAPRPWGIPEFREPLEKWTPTYLWASAGVDDLSADRLDFAIAKYADEARFEPTELARIATKGMSAESAARFIAMDERELEGKPASWRIMVDWARGKGHESLVALVCDTFGETSEKAYAAYALLRSTMDGVPVAEAYIEFLRTLPPSDYVRAEMIQAAIDSRHIEWAAKQVDAILREPNCPLWLRGAGTFVQFPMAHGVRVRPAASDPAAVLLGTAGPEEAIWNLLELRLPLIEFPGLPSPTELWDWIEVEHCGGPYESIWGCVFDEGDAASDLERPAFLTSAAITSWLLDRTVLDTSAERSRPDLLVVSLRFVLDGALRQGQLTLAAQVSALLSESLQRTVSNEQKDLLGAVSEGWVEPDQNFLDIGGWFDETPLGQFRRFSATIQSAGMLSGALAILAVPRLSLKTTSLPEPIDALIRAIPPDSLLGGETTRDALKRAIDESRDMILKRLPPGAISDAATLRERGRLVLIEVIPDIADLKWNLHDLTYVFGRDAEEHPVSVASDRARAVGQLMYQTFPSLGSRETFNTVADHLAGNSARMYPYLRDIKRDEYSTWVKTLTAAASSRNHFQHPRSDEGPTESDYMFWSPERYAPGARPETVFDLLRLFAEAQRRRLGRGLLG